MKKRAGTFLPFCLFLLLLLSACSTVDCPIQIAVRTGYSVFTGERADTLHDTLYVWTRRSDGTDTLLLNRGVGLTSFTLPVSYQQTEDTLFFCVADTAHVLTVDTVWIAKTNIPHFESVDCSPGFFHELTGVRCTHYGIDSISIHHKSVTYDPSNEHFHITFKARP